VLTVTLNPTLDVATRVKRLVHREKLRCESEAEQVGGGGINVAQVLHSFGTQCIAALTSGGWRGKEIERRLASDGISCLSMPIAAESRQCFTVYETSTSQEYRFILPGPTLTESEAQDCLERIAEAASRSDWLVLSGSLPPGVPPDFYYQILKRVASLEIHTAIDTSGQALAHALQSPVSLIKPSREELSQLLGRELQGFDQYLNACRELIHAKGVGTIALSLGGEGALVCQQGLELQVGTLPVKVTSTVGAGDSFLAGLVWSSIQGLPLEKACQIATATAAEALQTQGKLMFNRQSILDRALAVPVRQL